MPTASQFAPQARRVRLAAAALALAMLAMVGGLSPALAESSPPVPEKVQQALDLLADPEVAAWIKANARADGVAPAPQAAPPSTPWQSVSAWLESKQSNLRRLADVLPQMPSEIGRVLGQLSQDMAGRSLLEILLLVGTFVGLGAGLEWLYWRMTAGLRQRIGHLAEDPQAARGHGAVLRLAFGLGVLASFAAGTVGAFLLFRWPPLIREVVLGYLMAVVFYRLAATLGRLLLAPPTPRFPNTERYRLIPVDSGAARLWQSRLARLAGWCGFAAVTMALVGRLGMQPDAQTLMGAFFMLGVAALFVELIWRQHRRDVEEEASGEPRLVKRTWLDSRARTILLTGLAVVLWLLWVAGFYGVYWLLVLVVMVPWLLRVSRKTFEHLRQPAVGTEPHLDRIAPGLVGILIERLIVAAILVAAGVILIMAFSVSITGMTTSDTPVVRVLRGGLQALVILLVADLLWRLSSAWIDRWLRQDATDHAPAADHRMARLRTLVPILRNVMLIIVGLVGGMMALSALGIEIGPLIAGAGVAGVAIGFGAQTVVKDVISGIFYLLDDAFRVGEYIQSGSYKGTVESFSLRSVKLRHHRGPLFTVPFSELGAVQNMSRDWVIEKISIGVTYDTNLNKVKQIVKEIGKELAADPEYGPQILQTLKMQGVDAFGDYAIQIRFKIMTKPGDAQFSVKRRAFALIKRAFEQNGIQFAFPTVQVAGDKPGDIAAAAARQVAAPAGST